MTELRQKINNIVEEKNTKVVPENIRAGKTMFNVDGTFSSDANATAEDIVKGKTAYVNGEKIEGAYEQFDTSDADATAKDIAMNKTAYVNGEKITGTLLEPSMSSISTDNIIDTGSRVDIEGKMPTDYLFRKNSSITYNIKYPSLANAIGLTSEKIMKGNTVIGVSGNATSDADATADDIIKGKTAYVNGEKVVGTYEETGGESEYNVKLVTDSSISTSFKVPSLITEIGTLDLQGMTSMSEAFKSFSRLKKIGELKNTNAVTSLSQTFAYCYALEELPEMDTSSATSMNQMCRECTNIKKVPKMNTSKVTDFGDAFYQCTNLEEIPEDFDFSKTTKLDSTFRACKALKSIPKFNTSTITNFYYTFANCDNLEEVAEIDTSNTTKTEYMFMSCPKLKNFPNLNLSKVTDATRMLSNTGVEVLPEDLGEMDISKIPTIDEIFAACKKLTTVENLDLSGATTTAYGIFMECTALTKVSGVDLSNAINIYGMFNGCTALTEVSGIIAPKATSWSGMFRNCYALETIGEIDMSSANQTGQYFLGACRKLKNLGGFINYGKGFTQKSANYSNYLLYLTESSSLTHDSLMNVINNLYDLNLTYDVANGGTLYTQKLQLGSTNKAKLTAEEIAIATAKGWTVS
jgi:hypothetical protein